MKHLIPKGEKSLHEISIKCKCVPLKKGQKVYHNKLITNTNSIDFLMNMFGMTK